MLNSVWVLMVMALTVGALFGQSGAIQGIVQDQTQGAVIGSQVVLTNIDTGLRREVTTNETGFYTAPSLPVGRYKLVASMTGFSSAEVAELKLDVKSRRRAWTSR
ncbi:MAG: carboxypeptidase regulatory-like domain-containing protein [Bryobacterales bacterium]|nr:carboxypeptidase regulatory-like domain-containing protein [Bryobacterales bacterium]